MMDWKSSIYAAARDGDVTKLKEIVQSKSIVEISDLINYRMAVESEHQEGTPLVIASLNGHHEVVQFLIEHCGAEVEFSGSVTIEEKTIEAAPPLWCAAAAGHFDIVKYLIEHGANANNATPRNSTPLRAACFYGYINIVKYLIEHDADIEIAKKSGHTCLMISCYKGHLEVVNYLLEKNANINRKTKTGNTAIHECADSEMGDVEIIQLLVRHGAKTEKGQYGLTPLFLASSKGNIDIVEHLIQGRDVPKIIKIEALELLGATFLSEKSDMIGAKRFWERALALRNSNNPVVKPPVLSNVVANEAAVEVQNGDELAEIAADEDKMKMQALLVRERILGPGHPYTIFYMRRRGAEYADKQDWGRCIALTMYALDMQLNHQHSISGVIESFVDFFLKMTENDGSKSEDDSQVNPSDIYSVIKKVIRRLEQEPVALTDTEETTREKDKLLGSFMHLISLTSRLRKYNITAQNISDFKKLMLQLVKIDPCNSTGKNLLHLAVSSDTTAVHDGVTAGCSFPCLNCVELLLELKTSLEILDQNNNSALHIACMQVKPNEKIITALIEAGAHTDRKNSEGKRPMDYLA